MNKASELFSAVPHRHNCAQAVACGCGRDDLYNELQNCGGGRASGGVCGALYAAQLLNPAHAGEIAAEFAAQVGAVECARIKCEFGVPCKECVALAANLVEKYSK